MTASRVRGKLGINVRLDLDQNFLNLFGRWTSFSLIQYFENLSRYRRNSRCVVDVRYAKRIGR
jgi:hypothetical protein